MICSDSACERQAECGRRVARHGVTVEWLDVRLAQIESRCEICSEIAELEIDHDHTCCSGKRAACGECVRGLICSACNKSLGLMQDNPGRLEAAAEYLRRYADAVQCPA